MCTDDRLKFFAVTTVIILLACLSAGPVWAVPAQSEGPALAPGVVGVNPASGGNLEPSVPVTISGTGFLASATVRFTRAGQADINATEVTVDNATSIRCSFDLRGAQAGAWSVVVRNTDSETATLNNGFSIFQQFGLTAATVGTNGRISPTSGRFASGTSVTLTAEPDGGYRVRRWSGTDNDSSTGKTNVVTMTSTKVVSVEFEACPKFHYTGVVAAGRGTLDPVSGSYSEGTKLALTATPATGYMVGYWTGTDNDSSTGRANSVTINGDKTVTVTFDPDPNWRFELRTSVVGDHGTIFPGPIRSFMPETVVTLTAVPDEGYCVKQWTGTNNNQSTASTNTVTMNRDRTISVEFQKVQCHIQAQVVGGNGSLWPVGGAYSKGLAVKLTASPNPGFRVKRWTGTDADDSADLTNTVTVLEDNKVVTVEFEAIPDWEQPTPTPGTGSPTDNGSSGGPGSNPLTGCGTGAVGVVLLVLVGGLGIMNRRA